MTRTYNPFLRGLAQKYNFQQGFYGIREGIWAGVDPILAQQIADAYEALPDNKPTDGVIKAYRAFGNEIQVQFRFLEPHFTFIPTMENPYSGSEEMFLGIMQTRSLKYFIGGDSHPYLMQTAQGLVNHYNNGTYTLNDLFRIVHDLWGHAAEGYSFGLRGEENAWRHHSQMFTPLAQRALSTETRGQTCWFWKGPYSHLPPSMRPFAVQKYALLPTKLTNWKEL